MWRSHLRYDTLAQMLTLANIHAGSKVLVFETCSGLVLGAVMERMGGTSVILWTYLVDLSSLVSFRASLFVSPLYNNPVFPPHPGYGSVIQMYPGGEALRAGVESFGFPAHFHDMLYEFPTRHVNALLAGTLDTAAKEPSAGTVSRVFNSPLFLTFCNVDKDTSVKLEDGTI